MAIDQRSGTKVIRNLRKEDTPATRVDPHPYIGIVKNNLDPTRSGRVQVWIPDLGGVEDEKQNWRTVGYASPYMGYTTNPNLSDQSDTFTSVTNTYGMWMVPPDIGVHVIVIFIAGDPLRGYWTSCVNPNLSHHMLPGLAGSTNVHLGPNQFTSNVNIPVAEFNENKTENVTNSAFYNLAKPIHTPQYDILKQQGLDLDSLRGAISSSSQRETPSAVFGISTPGRPLNDPAEDPDYLTKLNNDSLGSEFHKVKTRKGGHTFVLDDGTTLGADQLVRLRTATGHQIMFHDTNEMIYLSHANGDSWIEMDKNGTISMYAKGGYNIRSEQTINFHSDKNINFDSGGSIKLRAENKLELESQETSLLQNKFSLTTTGTTQFKAGGQFKVQADAKISIKAGGILALEGTQILQNSGGTETVDPVKVMKENKLKDTTLQNGLWRVGSQTLNTICTTAPTHEPYPRDQQAQFYNPNNSNSKLLGQPTYGPGFDATKSTVGTEVTEPAGTKDLRNQPEPVGKVGNLSKDQLTSYMAQIGKSESSGNYSAVNELGYLGKYQFGYQALIDEGYIKSSVTSNGQMSNANSWTGKDGITSKESFLANKTIQESTMVGYTKKNYTQLLSNGTVTQDTTVDEVGGLLAVSHLLGAGGAKTWRNTGGGADANGTTGDTYFQKGKFAVAVLSPQLPAVQAG